MPIPLGVANSYIHASPPRVTLPKNLVAGVPPPWNGGGGLSPYKLAIPPSATMPNLFVLGYMV